MHSMVAHGWFTPRLSEAHERFDHFVRQERTYPNAEQHPEHRNNAKHLQQSADINQTDIVRKLGIKNWN